MNVFPAENKSPAPRANAENRAIGICNSHLDSIAPSKLEDDFAALYLSRRYGLALPMARVVAGLASIGGRFA
jgi:hypothetical protein